MSLLLVSLVLLAALAGAWLLWRGRTPERPAATPAARAPRMPVPATAAAVSPAQSAAPLALPPEALGSFSWLAHEQLAAERRQALVAAVRRIPRPPTALHQMLSPQFLDRASSNTLSELITGEAQIAAKVLATVNAPYYGLKRPVAGIGQAVTFLGLNTVRSICLQYLLDDSFQTTDPRLKRAHGEIWNASALASELCARLAAKLGLPDAGALVAQVLLSFLGHLATATLLVEHGADAPPTSSALLDRCRDAQARLGLGPSEIGALLLQEWGLPESIVNEVRAIDRLLVTPVNALPAAQGSCLAVAHLCARLGEHMACGGPITAASLAGLAAGQAMAEDGFYLRAHLASASLARLNEHLQSADLAPALQTLQLGMQARR
jgi:HD-like signal output (HDOD) protein